MQKNSTKKLVYIAMIAAVYTALCLALPFISYGPLNIRIAEALALLPVFSPIGVWGVTLGCFLANLTGFFTGANILGAPDILFGTAATFIAALLSRRWRGIRVHGLPVAAVLPPVLINALVIGVELAFVTTVPGESFVTAFAVNAIWVGMGQLISCGIIGLVMVKTLENTGIARRLEALDKQNSKIK
ncbi:MAG: QueT transporter family protein [Oscillospiraceae bacterium]|nr:QueT transporter family protein [Oscillospiraceae bacterium]